MADALTNITNLINSPPGQLVAGGVLAGIVWKFFERVEAVLNEDTKLEIAVWLIGVKTEQPLQHWPETFLVLFDKVFGSVHPSWKGLRRAFLATVLSYLILILIAVNHIPEIAASLQLQIPPDVNWKLLAFGMTFALIAESAIMTVPDYVSLMFTRRIIIRFHQSRAMILKVLGILFLTFSATYLILASLMVPAIHLNNGSWKHAFVVTLAYFSRSLSSWRSVLANMLSMLPLFVGGLWLALYGSSGLILKAARRFDAGFQWFNRRFDIEKKPLQSIGLVAGALVAAVYWAVVIVSRVV